MDWNEEKKWYKRLVVALIVVIIATHVVGMHIRISRLESDVVRLKIFVASNEQTIEDLRREVFIEPHLPLE